MLAENNPFEIVDAMKNVGAIYERSNYYYYSEENIGSQCLNGDCCSGCSMFDGMEYSMENIRMMQVFLRLSFSTLGKSGLKMR